MLPTFSLDKIAHQLTDVGQAVWNDTRQRFDVQTGGTLTYDISGLNAAGKQFALAALDIWANVSGLKFVAATGTADIVLGHATSGAYTLVNTKDTGGTEKIITRAEVLIAKDWMKSDWYVDASGNTIIARDSYTMFTFVHELGHALGLAHAGNYNGGTPKYPASAHYANDSWQVSIMSYFSQTDNTSVNADYAVPITPMIADIIAMHDLYGTPTDANGGNTVYGAGGNTGTLLDDWVGLRQPVAVTLMDSNGIDTLNLGAYAHNQRIDLRPEGISDVNGLVGNMIIARGTDIENLNTGRGNDTLWGNAVANVIKSGAGNDVVSGLGGADTVVDGMGNNRLSGDGGDDAIMSLSGIGRLTGGGDSDKLIGGFQADHLDGGTGNDVLRGDAGRLGGSDTLIGGTGNDIMMGGAGADTFVFKPNDGQDTIARFDVGNITYANGYSVAPEGADFTPGIDTVQLTGFSTAVTGNVMSHVQDGPNGAVFSAEGTSITFYGVDASLLSADDFIFA